MATFRLVLSLAAQYGWGVDHMDVVMAFLNPKIDGDNIYMELPLGIDWLTSTASATGRASTGSTARSALTESETGSATGSALILRKALYG
jgi:hypothetical protein